MKKILVMMAMLSLMAVSAFAIQVAPEVQDVKYLNGHVYESDVNSPGVADVTVYVACGESIDIGVADSVVTDSNGYYHYTFYQCDSDYVTAATTESNAKTNGWDFLLNQGNIDLYLSDIDFNVPEFTTIGAAIALLGAGFVVRKKRQ